MPVNNANTIAAPISAKNIIKHPMQEQLLNKPLKLSNILFYLYICAEGRVLETQANSRLTRFPGGGSILSALPSNIFHSSFQFTI